MEVELVPFRAITDIVISIEQKQIMTGFFFTFLKPVDFIVIQWSARDDQNNNTSLMLRTVQLVWLPNLSHELFWYVFTLQL